MTFRADVVAATGVDGVFGFAIPMDLLAPLGPAITVTDVNNKVLPNGRQVVLPSMHSSAISETPVNIFLHIPKTAGTGVRDTLLRTVPPGEVALIYPGVSPGLSLDRFDQVPTHQRERLTWIFGHCQHGIDALIDRPARYIAFIRAPKARLWSNVAHHVMARTTFFHAGQEVDLRTVFNENLSEEFDNVMTRVLAGCGQSVVPLGGIGVDEVERAVEIVRRDFCFVGRQSRAADDVVKLQRHLGLPQDPLSTANVTPPLDLGAQTLMASLHWRQVHERNQADQMLVERLEDEGLLSRILG